jgi:hypothetical protein
VLRRLQPFLGLIRRLGEQDRVPASRRWPA